MKIAYLIIAHNEPHNVFNLVKTLNEEDHGFFIHFKKGVEFNVPEDIAKMKNVFFAKERFLAGWCGFNVIAANLHLLDLAMQLPGKFDYFINLSGNCFPVYDNSHISDFFKINNFSFIEGHPLPYEKLQRGGLEKVTLPWFQDRFQNANPYIKKFAHKLIHFPYRLFKLKRKFPKGYVPYFGSQWWALTNEAATVLLSSSKENLKLLNFFKKSWCSDEQYIQTVIYNTPSLQQKIKNEPFRYIDWNTNGPPKTLILDDHDTIINSGKLFMRKVNPSSDSEGLVLKLKNSLVSRA